jgi:predicted ATPase/DNA-binding SARP family transcriptional activator
LLLLRLLLSPNEVVSLDSLFDALWGDRPPATARKLIQLYVHELRSLLGEPTIETVHAGYRLSVDPEALDSVRFEQLAVEGRQLLADGNVELGRTILRRALELWRGPAFADAAYEDFARLEAERLEELRLACLEARVSADALVGAAGAGELRAVLMTALYREGRQSDALAVYEQGRLVFDEQFGLEPTPRLRELQRQILNQDPALEVGRPESLPPLPVAPTRLLGRDQDLDRLGALVGRPEIRLVTIVGAGGIGKSRVALELARRSQRHFANGTYLVELAQVRDARHVEGAILDQLGGREGKDTDRLIVAQTIGKREVLLVMDNVEHLATVGDDIVALIRSCPRLTILATSRRVLHLSGEHVFPLAPLQRAAAIELFRSRSEAAAPGDHADEALLSEICRRLDDLPLAIELAASRTATLTPTALLDHLDDRLGLLVDGPRDLPDRQRTLRETLRWSGSLLRDSERRGLAGLGVFIGGCSLEAAHAVAGVGLEELHTLIAHSLVNRTVLENHPRFGLHETVREYALELLGPREREAKYRHAAHFAELAWRYFEFLTSPEYLDGTKQAAWLRRLDADAANLRAAFDHAVGEGDSALALRLVAGLWRYRHVRGHLADGLAEAEQALKLADAADDAALTGAVRIGGAGLAYGLGRYDIAASLARDALAAAPAAAATMIGAENVLGLVASRRHDFEAARRHFARMRDRAAENGSEADEMTAVINLGEVAYAEHDYEKAADHWTRFLAYWETRGSHEGIGLGAMNLGFAALRSGDLPQAANHLRKARSHFDAIGFREQIGYTLIAQAAVEARIQKPTDAAHLLGAGLAILEEVGAPSPGLDDDLADETTALLRETMGHDDFERAVRRGRERGALH